MSLTGKTYICRESERLLPTVLISIHPCWWIRRPKWICESCIKKAANFLPRRGHLSPAPARPDCKGAHISACGRDEAFRVVRLSPWHNGRSASEFLSQKPYNAIRAAKQESGIPKALDSSTASWRSSAQSAVTNRLIAL